MPEEQQRFAKAVNRMMDAIIFENWIRFYFLGEEEVEGAEEPLLMVAIPEKAMEQIQQRYGSLHDMALALNGREASLDSSRSAIVNFIRQELEGTLIPVGTVASYFDTRAFQNNLNLFNAWIQAAEEMLDRQFLDFDQWRDLFAEYRDSDAGQKLMAQMDEDARDASGSAGA
ncbi:MAG: hypothetical protein Q4F72_01080 [Desulfovibrionaceae bacterium]|nr:hypothetical protein [Desulfovibrionaceae bacterium]